MSLGNFIHRAQNPERFTIFRSNFFESTVLTMEGRAMLALLLERKPDWKLKPGWLIAKSGWGRGKVYKVLAELRTKGNILHIQKRGKGRYSANLYYVFDTPDLAEAFLEAHPNLRKLVNLPDADPEAYASDPPDTSDTDDLFSLADGLDRRARVMAFRSPRDENHDDDGRADGLNGGAFTACRKTGYGESASPNSARLVKTNREAELTGSQLPRSSSPASPDPARRNPGTAGAVQMQPKRGEGQGRAGVQLALDDSVYGERAGGFDPMADHLPPPPLAMVPQQVAPPVPKQKKAKGKSSKIPDLIAPMLADDVIEAARQSYNASAEAASLPRCEVMNLERRVKLSNVFGEIGSLDNWTRAMAELVKSGWLTGRSTGAKAGWKATIEFCLRPGNAIKLLEGYYADKHRSAGSIVREAGDPMLAHAARAAEITAASGGASGGQGMGYGPGSTDPDPEPWMPADPVAAKALLDAQKRMLAMLDSLVDPHLRTIKDLSVPAKWLREGAHLEWDIVPAISETLSRLKLSTKIRSWGFFNDAVLAARDKRLVEQAKMRARLIEEGIAEIGPDGRLRTLPETYTYAHWRECFYAAYEPSLVIVQIPWRFESLGPEPGQVGCLAPPTLQEQFGFKPTPDCWERWADRLAAMDAQAALEKERTDKQMAVIEAARLKRKDQRPVSQIGALRPGMDMLSIALGRGGKSAMVAPPIAVPPDSADDLLASGDAR